MFFGRFDNKLFLIFSTKNINKLHVAIAKFNRIQIKLVPSNGSDK